MAAKRSSDELRASIQAETQALSTAIAQVRHEVSELTDWRKQASKHREQLITGAAIAGAVVAAIAILKRLLSD